MTDKTRLILPGHNLLVPRLLKRSLQIVLAALLSALVILLVMVANGLFSGRGASWQGGINLWLAFIKRPDIYATMLLTAILAFVVWWNFLVGHIINNVRGFGS